MAQASKEKLEHTGPAENERVASVPQKAVIKYARVSFAKRKRNRAVCSKHQIVRGERVKVGESHTLTNERGIRAGAWRGKGKLHGEGSQVPRRTGRASK